MASTMKTKMQVLVKKTSIKRILPSGRILSLTNDFTMHHLTYLAWKCSVYYAIVVLRLT